MKKTMPQHIMFKLLEIINKEKNNKVSQRKKITTADFSLETMGQ